MNYAKLRAYDSGDLVHRYTHKDSILYALGVGFGMDPSDPHQLAHLYEEKMRVLPTMASILAAPGAWMKERKDLGIQWRLALHGSERVTVHQPLPAQGTLVGRTKVVGISDKGADKGSVVALKKTLRLADSNELVAVCERQLFLRGDGGFASDTTPGDLIESPRDVARDGGPSHAFEIATRPDQALIYRLSGDMNPLHADPDSARRAGYPRPILHGLSTMGTVCQGLVRELCGYDANRIREIHVRFAAPVFPGETLRVSYWLAGRSEVGFNAEVVERDAKVLCNGFARWT
jgi:acyl dehydratase